MFKMNIIPSSESHFFDYNQIAPINQRYPSPSNIINQIIFTESGVNLPEKQSIFEYKNLSGQFSNYINFSDQINNFQSFNEYIHYYPMNVTDLDEIDNSNMNQNRSLKIPYLSSYKINFFAYNPYAALF